MMIRQFQPQDATQCCSIIHACLANDSSISESLREKLFRAETPEAMMERAKLFYVAVYESENQVLGVAGLDLNEIRLLCVTPDHRRSGIGRSLLSHIQSMVPSILFPDVFVYSSVQGRDFYHACGFSEKGTASFEIDGDQLPTFFMTFPVR